MSAPMGVLSRLFIAPAATSAADEPATIETALPAAVAVVGRDRCAIAAGCAAGLVLARRARAPAALVCVRGGGGDARATTARRSAPSLGARRLAAGVAAACHGPVAARGRLVVVDLDAPGALDGAPDGIAGSAPDERVALPASARPEVAAAAGRPARIDAVALLASARLDAAAAAARGERAMAAAGSAPTVLVLAGAREAAFDRLLDAQDAVAVACAPSDPLALAGLALAALPSGAVALRAHVGRPAAALATGGITVAPSLARLLAPLIGALA